MPQLLGLADLISADLWHAHKDVFLHVELVETRQLVGVPRLVPEAAAGNQVGLGDVPLDGAAAEELVDRSAGGVAEH